MKKHILRVAMTLTFGLIMAMAMSTVAFADDGTVLTIDKELTATNASASLQKVYGPGLTYNFGITSPTIQDGTRVNGIKVVSGPTDGLTVQTQPSFPIASQLDVSTAGTGNNSGLELKVDLNKFNHAGVYRYKLTDSTTPATLSAAGVNRAQGFDTTRFVDVYIENDDLGNPVVAGYVVFNTEDIDPQTGEPTPGSSNDDGGSYGGQKSDFTGDDPASGNNNHNPGNSENTAGTGNTPGTNNPRMTLGSTLGTNGGTYTPDNFTTYNITLNKTVEGNMGNKENLFPFVGTIANNNNRQVFCKKGAVATESDTASATVPSRIFLKHGEMYSIVGLSSTATIAWTETNNTTDAYKVTVNGDDGNALVTQSEVAAGSPKVLTAQSVTGNAKNVTFVNNLTSVSPTGFAMRFGAPLMILFAGIAAFLTLLMIMKAQKNLN